MSRLLNAFAELVRGIMKREPFAYPRRYRVVKMRPGVTVADTRADLQIVNKTNGFPDMLMIPLWQGVGGAQVKLQPGVEVLVQFPDGDPSQPLVTHYAPKDDPRWRPVSVVIDATTVKIGPTADLVELGSGNETAYVPGTEVGRVVRWGDTFVDPTSGPVVLVVPTPGTTPVSKVKA